jgi:hypothetical protein
MKVVYFVNQDFNRHERQSDGVEFCVIPEFYDDKLYFYCSEYCMFWDSVNDVGDFQRCCDFKLKGKIRPATLAEIHDAGLCLYVDTVKEYVIEGGKVVGITYIHLKSS